MIKPAPVRSVMDASRFTAKTLHGPSAAAAATVRRTPSLAAFVSSSSSSSSSSSPSPKSTASRFQSPAGSRAPSSQKPSAARRAGEPAAGASATLPGGETPAQKVARLRAAHQAAKDAKVSQLDKIIGSTRRAFDAAHRFTIVGLIGFTAIAGLLTAYTTVDMLQFNSRRKKEFKAAQLQMEADSLAAARLAFMRGEATPEQRAMVEAAQEQATAATEAAAAAVDGKAAATFELPKLFGMPTPVPAPVVAAAAAESAPAEKTEKASGIRSWVSSTLSREEEGEAAGSSQRRLGYESLCEEDDAQGVRESDVVRALEQKQKATQAAYQAVTERAQAALERERANQREGGPLDRLGLEEKDKGAAAEPAAPAPKKSWW